MNARFALFSSFAAASIVACGSAFSTGDSGSSTSTGGASTSTASTASTTASTGGASSVATATDATTTGTGGADCFSSDGMNCGDPACQGVVTCEPAGPPNGWTAPMLVAIADDKSALPDCPDYLPTRTDHVELVTPTPDRGCKCHCDDGSGSCKVPLFFANSPDCLESMSTVVDGTCTSLPTAANAEKYFNSATPLPTTTGTCPVSVHAAAAPELIQDHARFCAGDTLGGCAGTSCLPIDTKEFAVCIVANGDMPCAVPYAKKLLVYDEAVTDNRTCDLGTCGCGAASGGVCAGTITVYEGDSCSGNTIGTVGTSCAPQSSVPGSVLFTVPDQTCTASGAPAVTGQVDSSGQRTVCCLP